MDTFYPIFYGTRLVTMDVLRATFEPHMHPEAARRGFNFIEHHGGKFGIGGGRRTVQPDKPGFADSILTTFHGDQQFPSGLFYVAWDTVVVNPGHVHRSPTKSEVPWQGSQLGYDYGFWMNVSTEAWHGQPVPLDGHSSWVNAGRPDLQYNYPIVISAPRPQPPQPPVPPTQPPTTGVTVQFNSRDLAEGAVGPDVKFYQRQLNEIAGQGLLLDGHYGAKTTQAVKNWQSFFKTTSDGQVLVADGQLGAKTQQSIIEVSLNVS